jgi:hypothetical protein
MSSESETDKLDAHNQADNIPVCQTRNPGTATVIRPQGFLILRRITDSPVHAVECRHHYEATGDDSLLGKLHSYD